MDNRKARKYLFLLAGIFGLLVVFLVVLNLSQKKTLLSEAAQKRSRICNPPATARVTSPVTGEQITRMNWGVSFQDISFSDTCFPHKYVVTLWKNGEKKWSSGWTGNISRQNESVSQSFRLGEVVKNFGNGQYELRVNLLNTVGQSSITPARVSVNLNLPNPCVGHPPPYFVRAGGLCNFCSDGWLYDDTYPLSYCQAEEAGVCRGKGNGVAFYNGICFLCDNGYVLSPTESSRCGVTSTPTPTSNPCVGHPPPYFVRAGGVCNFCSNGRVYDDTYPLSYCQAEEAGVCRGKGNGVAFYNGICFLCDNGYVLSPTESSRCGVTSTPTPTSIIKVTPLPTRGVFPPLYY